MEKHEERLLPGVKGKKKVFQKQSKKFKKKKLVTGRESRREAMSRRWEKGKEQREGDV